ncbi:MAG: DUF3014 domain-containing protein [Pseudomonadota bacterium]
MKASQEDRLEARDVKSGSPIKLLIALAIIVMVAYLVLRSLYDGSAEAPVAPQVVEEEVVAEPALPPAEDIPPRPEPPIAAVTETEPLLPTPSPPPPLPALEDSDVLVRETFELAGPAENLDSLQQPQNLILQSSAVIEGLSRGLIVRKMLALDPPSAEFMVVQEGDQTLMSPAGYARYDTYAQSISELNTTALIDGFHLLRPLYEQAYGQLGLPEEDFDNAVIRVLDRILATPEIETPIVLTQDSVMYQFADPQLESLSPLQKQLLRMGPENTRLIKQQAAALRAGLLNPQTSDSDG